MPPVFLTESWLSYFHLHLFWLGPNIATSSPQPDSQGGHFSSHFAAAASAPDWALDTSWTPIPNIEKLNSCVLFYLKILLQCHSLISFASLPTCRAKNFPTWGMDFMKIYETMWNLYRIPQLGEMKPHKSLFWMSTQGYLWHTAIYLPLKDLHLPDLAFQSHQCVFQQKLKWWFPSMGVPQARWMIYNGKSICKWMIWGYPYFRKPPNGLWLFMAAKNHMAKTGSLCSTEPLLLRQPPEDVDLNNKQGIQAIWRRKDLFFFNRDIFWGPQKKSLSEEWTSRNPMVGNHPIQWPCWGFSDTHGAGEPIFVVPHDI